MPHASHSLVSVEYTRLLVRTGSQIGFFVISANYYVTRSQPFSVHLLERDSSLQFGKQLTWLQSPRVRPPTSTQNDLTPISLLPTAAKVLQGIVKDWLMRSLDPILDQIQFGCRPGRSTTHALVAVLHK